MFMLSLNFGQIVLRCRDILFFSENISSSVISMVASLSSC